MSKKRGNPNFIKKIVVPTEEPQELDEATKAQLEEIERLTADVVPVQRPDYSAVEELLNKFPRTTDGLPDYYSAFAEALGIDRELVKKVMVGMFNRMHPAKLLNTVLEHNSTHV